MLTHTEAPVFERIRRAILEGAWAPGQRLAPGALSERFDTSTTVVREALTRLVGENLVAARTNRGFFIPELDLREFRDLTELRCVTEALALRLSIERGDLQWETTLIAAHHRLTKTPRRTGADHTQINEEWSMAHRAFHQALLAACACEPMIRLANSLALSTDLYRRWAAPAVAAVRRDVEQEHRDILEAALSRDAARASGLLREHYEETARVVLSSGLAG
ncbi:GntR family transcriptional regulator [Variovorax sp. M-6]|uniref:GntR family transcriptional regulator n=1 Tax=Variovorax sp. M-6 TaxID=3233041 RepID=UPI003F993BB2